MMQHQTIEGSKSVRPHFSFIVLAFGFLVIYNILSWLPLSELFGKPQFGDIRIDLAVPSAIIVLIGWAILSMMENRR
jgi:hypothetical protein